ncbi:MAG: HD domain-containing protein [Firmicutes bacterium]|nr:HD domain-containing protein [Bacillota bacterium]
MDTQKIISLFPKMACISDEKLRELSIKAMSDAMEAGGWNEENVCLAPATVSYEGVGFGLIEHINLVTDMCMDAYERLSGYYEANGSPLDRDTVLCGALLHDIGKFTEYTVKDGAAVHGENADIMRHPLAGAVLAAKAGLPDSIIHLIATHSFEGDRSYLSQEAKFVRTLDLFAFNCSVAGLAKK